MVLHCNWVGSKRILGEIKALLRKYMWSGAENIARAQVSWDNHIMLKKVGGLSFTSLDDAMQALVNKWSIQALVHG